MNRCAAGIPLLLVLASGTAYGQCLLTEVESEYNMFIELESPCMFEEGGGFAFAFFNDSLISSCKVGPYFYSEGDISSMSGYGSATASVASGRAYASFTLTPTTLSIHLETRTRVGTCTKGPCASVLTESASAGVHVVTEIDCPWSLSIDIDTMTGCPSGGGSPDPTNSPDAYWISYTDSMGNPAVGVFGRRCEGAATGCGDSDSSTVSFSGNPGTLSFGFIPNGGVMALDFNEDGRLNQDDVDDLALLLPIDISLLPSDTDGYGRFDFDTDSDVESDDLADYAALVDILGHGYLGDDDGDGDLDCDDLPGLLAHPWSPGVSICDPEYRVEFDADLDGDNDVDDRAVIMPMVQPGDLTGDGVLNFFDMAMYLDWYNTMDPRADLFPVGAPDGMFNFFDMTEYLDRYNNQACP